VRIVVQHTEDPEEMHTAIPGKVTAHIEMEDGSDESTDPVVLTLGQQLTYTVTPGSSTEAYLDDTQIQAVIDDERPAAGTGFESAALDAGTGFTVPVVRTPGGCAECGAPQGGGHLGTCSMSAMRGGGGLAVNPTYAKALGTDEAALCAKPECHHPRARHTGARSEGSTLDRDAGLKTACDEFGCSCGGFRETAVGLVTIVPARGEKGHSIEMEYDPEAKLVQFVKWGEEVFGTLEPITPDEWAIIADAFAAPRPRGSDA
jgi:hypothetical protein